eukprot:scaffold3851_cov387-Prasinococcus_capsulatus_cf.AAC.2
MSVGAMSTAPPAFSLQCNRTLAPHGGASTRVCGQTNAAAGASAGCRARRLEYTQGKLSCFTLLESEEEQPKPWEQEPLDEDDVTVPGNKVVREAITDVYEMVLQPNTSRSAITLAPPRTCSTCFQVCLDLAIWQADTERQVLNEAFALLSKLGVKTEGQQREAKVEVEDMSDLVDKDNDEEPPSK